MTSKLVPSDPEKVMVIRKVTSDIITMSVPFLRAGLINIGGRGTLVRLQNGTVACFSPVALTDEVRRTVDSLGKVKYIAAPDQEHHIFMDDWHKAYPDARLIGPEPLKVKREQSGSPLPWTNLFKADREDSFKVDEAFDREFDAEYVHGHRNKELVFCHRPSRTLIEADLLFNLPATEQMSRTGQSATSGIFTRLMTAVNHTADTAVWQKRFIWYVISTGDRPAYNKSVAKIERWDFDRIIPCHGDVIEKGGKGIFQKIMEWHITAARKQN